MLHAVRSVTDQRHGGDASLYVRWRTRFPRPDGRGLARCVPGGRGPPNLLLFAPARANSIRRAATASPRRRSVREMGRLLVRLPPGPGSTNGVWGESRANRTSRLLREPRQPSRECSRIPSQLAGRLVGAPGSGPVTCCAQGRRYAYLESNCVLSSQAMAAGDRWSGSVMITPELLATSSTATLGRFASCRRMLSM